MGVRSEESEMTGHERGKGEAICTKWHADPKGLRTPATSPAAVKAMLEGLTCYQRILPVGDIAQVYGLAATAWSW